MCAGPQETELASTSDPQPLAGWDTRPAVAASVAAFHDTAAAAAVSKRPRYPQTLIAGPSLLPTPGSAPDPASFHMVPGGVASQPADWAQLQVQMQLLSQHNPAFFAQMQQFLWSQNMAQLQMQAAAAAAQGYHIQQPQPGGGVAVSTGPTTAAAGGPEYQDFSGTGAEYGAGGAAGAQYVAHGGLFIPPTTHMAGAHLIHPHQQLREEDEAGQQGQRRSLAIPIVPPKVCQH